MLKIIRSIRSYDNCRYFHCSSIVGKRHSRPGAGAQVGLPELIIDKPPTHYPNIQQKLNKINYYDDPLNTKNIGFDESTKSYQNFLNQSANNIINHTKSEDDSLELSDEPQISYLSKEEYDKLSKSYSFSEQYISSTIQLAHHYAIFRDLFFQEPFRNETRKDLIEANAKDEVKYHKLKHQELYYFAPLVPICAEFVIQTESETSGSLKAYQGNLIPAEYGSRPPIININTSAINDCLTFDPLPNESFVNLNCGQKPDSNYYTLALVNLDSHFADAGVCHWMLANINRNGNETTYDTIVKYLPIYAINGFGYHRYSFVLFQHEKKLTNLESVEDFDLAKRKFNGLKFMQDCSTKNESTLLKPLGLSWFQTTWSDYCKSVFHDVLNMRCPKYEYIFPKQVTQFEQLQYPGRSPFNLYLDSFRDPKDISRDVLLERLKNINPLESYDTDKMYPTWHGRPNLPNIHPFPKNTPDWLKSTLIQKRNQVGRFRGLRASSAILPYNNNADLDNPRWPRISANVHPLNMPNPYPDGKRRPKLLRETLWHKPVNEHHSLRVDFEDNLTKEDRIKYDQTPKSS